MNRDQKLASLGFPLSDTPGPAAKYELIQVVGKTAYISGCLPISDSVLTTTGRLGEDVELAQGAAAARLCAANILRIAAAKLGSLSRVGQVVRLGGYVSSSPTFFEQHLVLNGASELMTEVLGEAGRHTRSAIGVPCLPLGACVEVDALLMIDPA